MVSHAISRANYFVTSIGKKQVMAVSGLGLMGFLFVHMTGNFLLLAGPDAFNLYAYKLTSTPLIYVAEAGLAGIFLLHLGLAFLVTAENKRARPVSYYKRKQTGVGGNLASSHMLISGLVVLVFIVLHLIQFKFGPEYETVVDGVVMRDLHRTVIEFFQNPWGVAWYVGAMTAMVFHLFHGFQSSFQTLGLNHPKYTPWIVRIGHFYAFFLGLGFSFLCIWAYFQ